MPEHLKTIRTVMVLFDLPIMNEELSQFRGAVIETTRRNNDLYHNHSDEGVIYRYPAIQYKKISGKAALVCYEKGTEAIHDFFSNTDWKLRIGQRQEEVRVLEVKARQFNVGVWENWFDYHLLNWMPLNQDNYKRYQQAESYAEKMAILESILLGNLLTFCEGMGFRPNKEVKAVITHVKRDKIASYRGQIMQTFDLTFRSNLSVPDYAALGKGASVGFGLVRRKKYHKNNTTFSNEMNERD